MLPHERSLVERHKGRPFAIVGVNSDPKSRFKSASKRERMTWQSFWDGGNTNGPISTRWAVSAWPAFRCLFDVRGRRDARQFTPQHLTATAGGNFLQLSLVGGQFFLAGLDDR